MKQELTLDKNELACLKRYLSDFKMEWQSRNIKRNVSPYHKILVARIIRNLADEEYDGTFNFSKQTEVSYLLKVLQFQLVVLHTTSVFSGEKEMKNEVFRFIDKLQEVNSNKASKADALKKVLEG